jgi:phosphatidate cytidylyltransferase
VLAAAALLIAAGFPQQGFLAIVGLPALGMALTPRRDRQAAALYATAVMVAGYGLIALRQDQGSEVILWVVGVVIASDVTGYFAGKLIGGPRFWPAISPNKTWAGTVAGWIAAGLIGVGFVVAGKAGWALVVLSPLVAFAGQMGDIAESRIKRRAGVKDASHLIPGHGGVMDRFDAMTGAVVAVIVMALLGPLPFAEG